MPQTQAATDDPALNGVNRCRLEIREPYEDRIEPTLEDAYISLVMPAPPSKLPTSGELWRRRGDEPSDTITASIPLVILPSCIGIDSSNF